MSKIAIIMVLPIEYNTSSMLRCRSIISALAEIGHNITCFCPYPDEKNKYFSNESINISDLKIHRFANVIHNNSSSNAIQERTSFKKSIKEIIRKSIRKIDVFGSTLLYLPKRKNISKVILSENFDILLTFSDPMPAHMIGKYCKRKNPKLCYIQQWGDPLASDTISKVAQPVWVRKIIERSLLKSADRICYVSPFTCEEQKKLYPKQAKNMIFLPTPSLTYEEERVVSNGVCLGYFGSYYSLARNLIPFYEAAKQHNEIKFYIIGDSDITLESTDNITVISRVSPNELNEYMKKIDVIVCLMNIKGNQIPGKVYHDASSSKDILFIKDGEYGNQIQTFFEKYNHYTFVENNIEEISKAFVFYVENGVPKRKPIIEFESKNIANQLIGEQKRRKND